MTQYPAWMDHYGLWVWACLGAQRHRTRWGRCRGVRASCLRCEWGHEDRNAFGTHQLHDILRLSDHPQSCSLPIVERSVPSSEGPACLECHLRGARSYKLTTGDGPPAYQVSNR